MIKPNPISAVKEKTRNVFCPNYDECLDYAAKLNWLSWDCIDCRYKTKKGSGNAGPARAYDAARYYSLPPRIFAKVA